MTPAFFSLANFSEKSSYSVYTFVRMVTTVVLMVTLVILVTLISKRVWSGGKKGENEVPVIIIERKRRYGRGKGVLKNLQSLD